MWKGKKKKRAAKETEEKIPERLLDKDPETKKIKKKPILMLSSLSIFFNLISCMLQSIVITYSIILLNDFFS